MYDPELGTEGLANLFKVLSKPDALEIFLLAGEGIEKSGYAIEELGFTPKKYYARLRELVDMGFVIKMEGVYRQTPFGSIIYSRLIPAMRRTYDARDRLGLIEKFKGTQIEGQVRNLIEDELNLPDFVESNKKVKILGTYEDLAIEAVDLYDSAEKSVLLASNYFDVRVMEACFRSTERDIINRLIIGKKSLSKKLQNLRMMLSLTFAKTIINFTSNKVDLREFLKFVDLPHTFCIVDGHRNIIEISNSLNDNFLVALSIDDRVVGKKLTELFEMIWEVGEFQPTFEVINSLKSN
ncbi:MAG: hypothetical protein NWE88_01110 [Candidatus Bathyarchaeota archaeon]|nr:hypothetical protein [Candidatus Bathyarchaeota archaeon]